MVRVTQGFGPASPETRKWYSFHNAVDYVPESENIGAWVGGTVVSAQPEGGYGGVVTIKGDDGKIYKYSHLRQFNVNPGQKIGAGTLLGLMGGGKSDPMAGTSTGRHVDFRVQENGKYIDPSYLLKGVAPTVAGIVSKAQGTMPGAQNLKGILLQRMKTNPAFRNKLIGALQSKMGVRQAPRVASATQGSVPNTGAQLPSGNRIEDYFGDIVQKISSSPTAMQIYSYFAPKYGDRVAKKMAVLSHGESIGWKPDAYAGGGEDSVGLFQINLNAHNDKVAKYTGTTNRATNREWLKNAENNIKIADQIYSSSGFGPWTYAKKGTKTYAGIRGNGRADLGSLI